MMLLSLVEAGKLLGLAPVTLRAQIANGKLAGRKIGRDWLVTAEEIERYARENRRASD